MMVDMMANDTSGRTAMMTGNRGPPLDFGQKVKDAVKALREACPEEHFMAGTYEFLYSCALSTLSLECQSMSHQSCSYPLKTTGCLLVDRINELNPVLEADANISLRTENFSLALSKWIENAKSFCGIKFNTLTIAQPYFNSVGALQNNTDIKAHL
jgi:hypothetical protein